MVQNLVHRCSKLFPKGYALMILFGVSCRKGSYLRMVWLGHSGKPGAKASPRLVAFLDNAICSRPKNNNWFHIRKKRECDVTWGVALDVNVWNVSFHLSTIIVTGNLSCMKRHVTWASFVFKCQMRSTESRYFQVFTCAVRMNSTNYPLTRFLWLGSPDLWSEHLSFRHVKARGPRAIKSNR